MAVFNGSAADIENNKNKVTQITGNEDADKYPNCQAVENFVNKNFELIETVMVESSGIKEIKREGLNYKKIWIIAQNTASSSLTINVSIYNEENSLVVYTQQNVNSGNSLFVTPIYDGGLILNMFANGTPAANKNLQTRSNPFSYKSLSKLVVATTGEFAIGSTVKIYAM